MHLTLQILKGPGLRMIQQLMKNSLGTGKTAWLRLTLGGARRPFCLKHLFAQRC